MDEKETLGKYLKRERELRKIPLREVAKKTRVREYFLRAIEEDQYDLLPVVTYVRGFLLSYAKYLGLDPNDVLLRYESFLKRGSITPPEVQNQKKITWIIKYRWAIGGTISICLIASYFLFLRPSGPPIEPISVKPTIKETIPPVPSPQIAGTTFIPQEKPFSLQLKAVEETWVSIRVNGQLEKEMTFKPGESATYRAMNRIQLIVGNAGGLDLVFNERLLERFGKSGQVIALIFTPKGVEIKRIEKPKLP